MTQSDVVMHHGRSIIQHGHYNNRVYIMKLATEDAPDIIRIADDLAGKEHYGKIFAKVPKSLETLFSEHGYCTEATVPFFFHGDEPAVFMAKYSDSARSVMKDTTVSSNVLSTAFSHAGERHAYSLPDGFSLMQAHAGDADDIAVLFENVFRTYPFPVTDPSYIRQSMQGDTRYYIIRKSHMLAAVASCEIDITNRNIEVTDFATSPLFRGRGFASHLLYAIESAMEKEGIVLSYTICRAISGAINSVFASAGYAYAGQLPNNTNICGRIESMNVWYRKLNGVR